MQHRALEKMPGNSRQKLKCDDHIDLFVMPEECRVHKQLKEERMCGSFLSGLTDFL